MAGYSVNAILTNDLGLLTKGSADYQRYIQMVVTGIEKSLAPYTVDSPGNPPLTRPSNH